MILFLFRWTMKLGLGLVVLGAGIFGYAWFRYAHSWTPVEAATFQSEGVEMSGLLVLPNGEGPHPAVVQVAGSGPLGKDHLVPKMHANALAKRGVATFYYDKRGVAGSGGQFYEADYRTFVADIHAAFDYLRTRDDIDENILGYIGHSEGGHLMPEVALARDDIKFAYTRVAPVLGYRSFSSYQLRIRMIKLGLPSAGVNEVMAFYDDITDYYIRSADDPDYFRSPVRAEFKARLNALHANYPELSPNFFASGIGSDQYRPDRLRRIAYSRTYCGCDFLEQLRGVPLFYVFGELDENVNTDASVAYLNDLKERTGQDIEIYIYKGDDHTLNKWRYLPFGAYQPGYYDRMAGWIEDQVSDALRNDG